jgi:hypothetical protein
MVINLLQVDKFNCFSWGTTPDRATIEKIVDDGTLLWRSATLFFPCIVGLPFFIHSLFKEIIKNKKTV